MAWLYVAICAFDFIIGPIIFTVLQQSADAIVQWQPLTLRAGGLFHVAMGAIVGVTAWTRGQEKIKYMDYFEGFSSPTPPTNTEIAEEPVPEPPAQKAGIEPVKKDTITK